MLSTENIDKLIIGRVDPHIYAFSTNTIPNYLKVGDTYRPVSVRIDEWRDIFPTLVHEETWEWLAKTKDGKYFRDFAVHYYLEQIKHLHRLQPNEIEEKVYYSREFFENATPQDIDEAIMDIERCAAIADNVLYQFYSEDRLPIKTHFERVESYPLRPNQKDAVNAFVQARENGRRNLLMYAVMRFGKSFTSMCCATAMNAKVVLIVSAKADVCTEWQRTVESHTRFEGYDFLNSDTLLGDQQAISKCLAEGKKVAVFLTLQDLMGEDIKTKHEDLFKQKIDLLIVDETHFGARANEYGRVLRASQLNAYQIKSERKGADDSLDDLEKGLEQIKQFNVDTTLHLSGTPYRILMGSEFKQEDIIAFCQFTDIIDDKEKWDKDHAKDIDNEVLNPLTNHPYQEWDNPYYGFPQMIRFAFNPNTSAQQLIAQLKKEGKTTALNELFRPQSISCDTDNKKHKFFVHEKEVLDLLRIIDGSAEDENILSFLDYDKLKEGKMCRHIVFVLPFCASCDAMQHLLQTHAGEFKNLQEYTIVNIAGIENTFNTTEEIKQKIEDLEKEDKKSITLTVNRMLTGSTIPQWDTMLFLKDVSSPQEYDQAIFRLQNQYVTTYKDEKDGNIKYDMKPQTLLVDFDPNRMFRMQEQKSQIYNVNADERGNEKLEARIERELQVSPIIVANKDKLVQVTPTNIMDAVRDYSASRTIIEEAIAIPVDMDIIKDPNILEVLKKINPIDAYKGISVKPTEGDGDDLNNPEVNTQDGNNGDNDNNSNANNSNNGDTTQNDQTDEEKLAKSLSTFFALILFYALLTDSDVKSLHDIIESVPDNPDNKRILGNLGLKLENLNYLQTHVNPFVLRKLDYKIQTSNQLLKDETYKPIERVEHALKKFGRMSEAEIVTPASIADEMIALLPKIGDNDRILDIASKQGEFACALYRRYGDMILNNVYSLPTSSVAYEFTRKVYSLLGMPIENVYSTFNSYDLISDNSETFIKTLTDMNFCAVIGNPPYQQTTIGTSDKPVYHLFMDVAFALSRKVSFITPARYLFNAGKTPQDWNTRILNDEHFKVLSYKPNSADVFPHVDIKGGIAIMYRDSEQDYGKIGSFTAYPELNNIYKKVVDTDDFKPFSNCIYAQNKFNLAVLYQSHPKYRKIIGSNGREKRLTTSIFSLDKILTHKPIDSSDIKVLGLINNNRVYRYIKRQYLEDHPNLEKYKVLLPKCNGTGAIGETLSNPIIGEPRIGITQSFISIGCFDTAKEAEAVLKYIKTRFARTLLGILKVTQDNSKETWRFVPLQNFTSTSDIDWSKSVAEIDLQLYHKYDLSAKEIAFIEKMIKPME